MISELLTYPTYAPRISQEARNFEVLLYLCLLQHYPPNQSDARKESISRPAMRNPDHINNLCISKYEFLY